MGRSSKWILPLLGCLRRDQWVTNYTLYAGYNQFTGWWFQICFIFTPTWGRFPFWLNIFQLGWNNQPDLLTIDPNFLGHPTVGLLGIPCIPWVFVGGHIINPPDRIDQHFLAGHRETDLRPETMLQNGLINVMMCLEPNWPLFWKVKPPNQCPFQSKQGSFGF